MMVAAAIAAACATGAGRDGGLGSESAGSWAAPTSAVASSSPGRLPAPLDWMDVASEPTRLGDWTVQAHAWVRDASEVVAAVNPTMIGPRAGAYVLARVSVAHHGDRPRAAWFDLDWRLHVDGHASEPACHGLVPDLLTSTPDLLDGGRVEAIACWELDEAPARAELVVTHFLVDDPSSVRIPFL